MADFKKIDDSIKLLELRDQITLDEIKAQFRKLSKKYHPDSCKEEDMNVCEEKFKQINDAYKTIMNYIRNYRYSFDEENVQKTKIEKMYQKHMKQFYDGWWGGI